MYTSPLRVGLYLSYNKKYASHALITYYKMQRHRMEKSQLPIENLTPPLTYHLGFDTVIARLGQGTTVMLQQSQFSRERDTITTVRQRRDTLSRIDRDCTHQTKNPTCIDLLGPRPKIIGDNQGPFVMMKIEYVGFNINNYCLQS